jgi:lysophospholipase L1-like esterase
MKARMSTGQNSGRLRGAARSGRASILALLSCWLYLLCPGVGTLAAQQVTYTALGDSLAFGVFAPLGQGYVPLYRNHLAGDTARKVFLYNLGVPGWNSQDLRHALETNFLFQLLVWSSEAVTVNIGGNDLRAARNTYKTQGCGGVDNQDCLRAAVASFKQNWDAIIGRILQLRGSRKTLIRTMDIYNPYVDEDKASDSWSEASNENDFTILKSYLEEVNQYIAQTSASFGAFAKVYETFNGLAGDEDPAGKGLLAFDGFHPNKAGHALMASRLRDLGYAPLLP